jgi:serine/threonine-protein kinase
VVDRRADVFAMGICLWEMLAQKRLFKAEFEAETLNRLLYEPIPPLRTVIEDIPAEIEAVVQRALTRDPDKRYATAAEFADALEHAAKPHDLVGTKREVSAAVEDVLGEELSERRAAVRNWAVESDPNRVISSPSSTSDVGKTPSGARAMEVPNYPSLPPSRVASMSVAVFGAALAAAMGMLEWQRVRPVVAAPTPPAESITLVATAIQPPVATPTPTSTSTSTPTATATATPTPTSTPTLLATKPAASHAARPSASAPHGAGTPDDMVVNPYR